MSGLLARGPFHNSLFRRSSCPRSPFICAGDGNTGFCIVRTEGDEFIRALYKSSDAQTMVSECRRLEEAGVTFRVLHIALSTALATGRRTTMNMAPPRFSRFMF